MRMPGNVFGLSLRFFCLASALGMLPLSAEGLPVPGSNGSVALHSCLQFARLSAANASARFTEARHLNYQQVSQDLIRTSDPLEQIWLRCELGAPQQSGDFILVFSDLRLDLIDVYLGDSTEPVFRGGDARSDFQSNFLRPNATIRLEKGRTTSLWIRLSGAYNVPTDVSIYGTIAFQRYARIQTFWQSMFFGILLVMIVFYGIGLFAFKDAAVRGYLVYLTGVTLYFLYRSGMYHTYISPQGDFWYNTITAPLLVLPYWGGLLFIRTFLRLNRISARLDAAVRTLQYLLLIAIPLAFFSRSMCIGFGLWVSVIVGPAGWILGWSLVRKSRSALLFSLIWGIPILSSIIEILSKEGFYALPVPREALLQGAIMVEVLCFAVLVGLRIRSEERTRQTQAVRLELIQKDLIRAQEIHSDLLPANTDQFPELQIHIHYQPMSYLGGDYYSFVRHGPRVGILVADVTGHGLPAALDASAVHVAHQTIYGRSQSAADVLSGMNEFLAPVSSYRFTSAVYAILDTDSGGLEVSRAGHPAPYILRTDGSVVEVGPEGPLLGMRPEMQYTQLDYQLLPEDRLILYTDGVFEVPDRGQGVESVPSVQEAIRRNSHLEGEAFAVAVCSLFAAFRHREDQDDVTLLDLKWEGRQTVR